jgi:hypothetical protein
MIIVTVLLLPWATEVCASTVTPTDAVTHYVVVRQHPSTNSTKLGRLNPGEQATVLQSVPHWFKVELVDGTVGYVSKSWVDEVSAGMPGGSGSVSGGSGPWPLVAAGHPVNWWFVFKFNSASFPECSGPVTRACPFGGEVQDYNAFSQQFVYATSETHSLQDGAGCLGDSNADPVGATFGQVYNGSFHYLIWNDQFYEDPPISGCSTYCSAPWGHSKGMIAWNDSGEGYVMQVTTPSWPASGSSSAPRQSDGNTLGCIDDNNVKVSQHLFALRLTHADLLKVLAGLQNASVVTDPATPQIVKNGGPADVQALVDTLGVQSSSEVPTIATLSSGVQLISKPSALHVPPWQMVSAMLDGVPLRVATWWSASRIDSTTYATSIGCWSDTLPDPGPVEIATSGQWSGRMFGLKGCSGKNCNHAKIGVTTSGGKHYAIFGDMNQEGALSGSSHDCAARQNGRGGLFFVVEDSGLESSVSDLINGDSAPTQ